MTSVDATAKALFYYALGLPAFVIIKVLQPSFFARYDTLTPVKIASSMVLVNLVLNIILMQYLEHAGRALATSISAWLNALLIGLILKRKRFHKPGKKTFIKIFKTFLASTVMGLGLLGILEFIDESIFSSGILSVATLVTLVIIGLILYIILVFLFRVIRISELNKEDKSWIDNDQ